MQTCICFWQDFWRGLNSLPLFSYPSVHILLERLDVSWQTFADRSIFVVVVLLLRLHVCVEMQSMRYRYSRRLLTTKIVEMHSFSKQEVGRLQGNSLKTSCLVLTTNMTFAVRGCVPNFRTASKFLKSNKKASIRWQDSAPPISGGTYRRRRTLIDGYLESPFPTACLL